MTAPPAIPATVQEQRLNAHRLRSLSLDAFDYLLFLPAIWLPCALGISLRLIGPLFVVIPIGFCLLYAVLRSTVPPRLLSAYVAYCIVVAVLSTLLTTVTSVVISIASAVSYVELRLVKEGTSVDELAEIFS